MTETRKERWLWRILLLGVFGMGAFFTNRSLEKIGTRMLWLKAEMGGLSTNLRRLSMDKNEKLLMDLQERARFR